MDREDFFEKLHSNCASDYQYIIELLKLRGFLFEEEKSLSLSDNSHPDDYSFLNQLLEDNGIGKISAGLIEIINPSNYERIENLFSEESRIGSASCWQSRSWWYFNRREHGDKAPVRMLEPFIARYIKAVSSCGILTVGSCDGNHPNANKMLIMMEGEGSVPWHKAICETLLIGKFAIDWLDECTAIHFSNETKYETYFELNRAAEFLYANRKKLRFIKYKSCDFLTKSYEKKHSNKEIEEQFTERAVSFLQQMIENP